MIRTEGRHPGNHIHVLRGADGRRGGVGHQQPRGTATEEHQLIHQRTETVHRQLQNHQVGLRNLGIPLQPFLQQLDSHVPLARLTAADGIHQHQKLIERVVATRRLGGQFIQG